MAVLDQYNQTYYSGSDLLKRLPTIKGGSHVRVAIESIEIAAGDDDGSVYRLFKGLDGCIIPIAILIGTDGITGGTDYDLGVYDTNLGAVVDKDCLMDGLTMASAADLGLATALDGMDAVDIADYGKKLYELAGHTEATRHDQGYDVALTANTVGTAGGTITVMLIYSN